MSFQTEIARWPRSRIEALIAGTGPGDVDRALARDERTIEDFAALLSARAAPRLETMAREAHRLTRWHFGRTIGLYTPLYLSNVCGADCVYCGYAVRSGNREKRVTLNEEQIRRECETLANRGFQNILLLTGEAPRVVPVRYIADAVAIAREYFASVSVEVYSMKVEEYQCLVERGLEGVTIYMETYDPETYARMHLIGAKKNYDFRLDASERAGLAGALSDGQT